MIDVLFLDLKMTFDSVDQKLLIQKLELYGMKGVTLDWFRSYLANRQQVCCANGVFSAAEKITCGVPRKGPF